MVFGFWSLALRNQRPKTQGQRPMKPQSASVTRLALGTLLVLAGLLSAVVTVLARRENENTLAGAAAALSLVIAALLTIFIVPPLARSARLEIANWDIP